jgi:glycosyltransferase involved in cell wall biosynthesis
VRVAVVAEQPLTSSSTQFRALQHLPRLRARLGRVDAYVADSAVERGRGRVDQARFFARHGVRYVRRRLELERALRGCDAVLVQRGAYPMGPAWVARPLERFGGRVVLDLDDAVFELAPAVEAKGRAGRWLYGGHQARALLARADAVVASTRALAEMLPARRADAILPTVPDPAPFPRVEHRDELPLRVGWTGTPGNIRLLDPLAEVLGRLRGEGVARLEVVSSEPWRRGPAEFRRWRLDQVPAFFARYEVGLMPLPDTPYTRAKAGFKLLQHMAAGAAVVASPVGVNVELVERSGGGLLADEPHEWEAALRRLADDRAERARMGAGGRAFVERYVDLEEQADTLAGLLRGVMGAAAPPDAEP